MSGSRSVTPEGDLQRFNLSGDFVGGVLGAQPNDIRGRRIRTLMAYPNCREQAEDFAEIKQKRRELVPDFSEGEWNEEAKAKAFLEAISTLFTREGNAILCCDTMPYPLGSCSVEA